MKIKMDSSHQSFVTKSTKNSEVKRIGIKIGAIFLVVGTLFVMSGCQSQNEKVMKSSQERNKQIMQLYYQGELPSAKGIENLQISYAPIDNDFVNQLPDSVFTLYLEEDTYVTDLSNLPSTCPYLESLYISNCHGISNYEFIKEFKNLKEFELSISQTGVDQELIDYLNANGIKHNLTQEHVELNKKVEDIVKSIITDDMTDEEKLNKITLYVMNNLKYDLKGASDVEVTTKYNLNPLKYALEGEGVCINFAVLTDALCQKAGIDTTVVKDLDHAWNMVCIEGKYYYVDTANINQLPFVSELLLKHFNIGFNYKNDPYATGMTAMSDVDNLMTPTPERILKLIEETNDQKSFIEKYGSNLYVDLIVAVGIMIGMGTLVKVNKNKKRR
ncbi:MAG: hypothetical protein IJE89_05720 [Bacilli bacterium]|nr:hypothetical protein [Bacilli bacterium]